MGMSLIGTNLSVPVLNRNYSVQSVAFTDTNPKAIIPANAFTPVARALFVAPTANTGTISVIIGGQTCAVLAAAGAAGSSFLLEAAPNTTFDLGTFQASSSNSASSSLNVFVQKP